MSAIIETPRMYTPTSKDILRKPISPATEIGGVVHNPHMDKLLIHMQEKISQNGILAFKTGENSLPPNHPKTREAFRAQMLEVVQRGCDGIFDTEGNINKDKAQEWKNVLDIAPSLVGIFTDPKNNIYSINREQTINLINIAVAGARKPQILENTVINSAIGGSDSDWTSTRLPAYIIPVVSIVRDVKNFYSNHTAIRAAEDYLQRDLKEHEKQEVAKIKVKTTDPLADFSPQQREAFNQKHGIPRKLPEGQIFSGASVARALNHTMEPEQVRIRNEENLRILRKYIDTTHNDVADNIRVIDSLQWPGSQAEGEKTISRYSRIVMDYLADLLDTSEVPEVRTAVENLKRRGEKRGGEAGKQNALIYTASHPPYFGDRFDLPFAKVLDGVNKPATALISIGGRTERQFDVARSYLTENANSDGFRSYIQNRASQSSKEEERAYLVRLDGVVARWQSIIANQREREATAGIDIRTRPDLPSLGTTQLLTNIGEDATYYSIPSLRVTMPTAEGTTVREVLVDRPFGYDVAKQIASLEEELREAIDAGSTNGKIKKENALAVNRIERIVFDLKALQANEKATAA